MKRFLILGALFALSACQTTSQSGNGQASVSEPLSSEVVFGTEAIHDGHEYNTWKYIFRGDGRKTVVTMQNKVAFNLVTNPKTIEYDVRILKSNLSVPVYYQERKKVEEEVASLRGKEFKYVYKHKKATAESLASFGDLQEGYVNLMGNKRDLVKSMIESASASYFGGKTVTQDQKVLALNFCVVAGVYPGSGPCDSTQVYGYVAGKKLYGGRTVVVVDVDDDMTYDEQVIYIDGYFYVDLKTGTALFSEIKLSGMKRDGTDADIVKTRLVKLPTS